MEATPEFRNRLKAYHITAQGNALGVGWRSLAALKGRDSLVSPFQGFASCDGVSRGVAPGWFVMFLRSVSIGAVFAADVFADTMRALTLPPHQEF